MVTGTANDLSFHLLFILIMLSVITKMRIYAVVMKINPFQHLSLPQAVCVCECEACTAAILIIHVNSFNFLVQNSK
jgi:hypothetical protein